MASKRVIGSAAETGSLLQLVSNVWSDHCVSAGEGKGWAKGKTAATDPRIARASASHRGTTYQRHVPPGQDRRHRHAAARTLALEWSPVMAYVVGLIATDGNLSKSGRHLVFGSSDRELVETFLTCLGRPVRYATQLTRTGALYYRTQFGDVRFYRWLQEIGLMQRKSLILGPLAVPDEFALHCARGLLDGDGSIINKWYAGTGKAKGKMYEVLLTRFVSGSFRHLDWLRVVLERLAGLRGCIIEPTERNSCWALSYAIRESCLLLPLIYPNADVPKLERKRLIWKAYAERHGHAPTLLSRAQGATDVGQRPRRDSLGRFQTLSCEKTVRSMAFGWRCSERVLEGRVRSAHEPSSETTR